MALVVPDVPQAPLPTSPDAPIPATTEVSSSEDGAAFQKFEEVQPAPFPQRLISTSIKEDSEPPEASHDELPVTDSRVPLPIPDSHITAKEPATESDFIQADISELGGLKEPKRADIPSATLLPQHEEEPVVPESPKLPTSEIEPEPKPPTYHPPTPPAAKQRASDRGERTPHSTQQTFGDLRLRVQIVFGRAGTVRTLALVPDKREGMPGEVEVTGRQGESRLIELRDDCYEPVQLADASNALREGIHWRGRGDAHRWCWVLSGRELYVLAPGDAFGLFGFVSTARLQMNTRHVILATVGLCDQVLAALANAGCAIPEVNDDNTPGVPSGWVLYRNVTTTRAVPMREEADILNALCPAHEIEPHFVGGIRLERNTWLVGFPPRIRFTGELGDSFRVLIDGQPAQPATDSAFESPGWDGEGEHRLRFADRAETYVLRKMDEGWERWNAHDFNATGATICGAGIYRIDGAGWYQFRIPSTNLLLIGARPGEFFRCRTRHDVRSENILALVPFVPVWALPIDPVHADKHTARLVLLNSFEPAFTAQCESRGRIREWVKAINDAGHKQLALANASEDGKALWRHYRAVAKRLWKRMR